MLSVLDLGPNIVAYRADGAIDRADIDRVFADLDRKIASPANLRVYGEVHSLSGLSFGAVWEDIRLSLQRWRIVSRIEKGALVTDIQWLKRAAIWEDKIFHGIHIRTFPLARQVEAQIWVRS